MSVLGTSWAYPSVNASVDVVARLEHEPNWRESGDARTRSTAARRRRKKKRKEGRMTEDEKRRRHGQRVKRGGGSEV